MDVNESSLFCLLVLSLFESMLIGRGVCIFDTRMGWSIECIGAHSYHITLATLMISSVN